MLRQERLQIDNYDERRSPKPKSLQGKTREMTKKKMANAKAKNAL